MDRIREKIVELLRFVQYGDLPTKYYTKRGMIIGDNFNRQSGCKFDPSHCWLISFGDNVTVSNGVQILAHDDSIRIYSGYGKVGTVSIGNNVFIGANATILMNVTIGNDVIIGAGAVVTKDICDNSIVAGVPAKLVGKTEDYVSKSLSEIDRLQTFDLTWTIYSKEKMDLEKKNRMRKLLKDNYGFQFLGKFVKSEKRK